ncbi:TGF-beta-induced transcription factor 2 [Hyphodiscus hymeniophilus]|uniref:TGF-beta-induced transcription factor 2 n=1 Tax=Hyphodiscus hymeniophilus TaxID=353542 RepID=A0A9P7AXI5_9HELO|nr:TGF-beta-induced transcription factor 2 [Hyphodiscus hymeniophilus]
MTTIDEMDEFFNFEDAAHPSDSTHDFSHLSSGPYDIDLAFAEVENDEDSFTCLQHFNTPEQQLSLDLQNGMQDTNMIAPDTFTAQDFTDFPRWIQGMNVPFQPCDYCKKMRIHCKVLKEGSRKGSCTSCVALARSCSLTYKSRVPAVNEDSFRCSDGPEGVCVPDDGFTPEEFNADDSLADWNDVMRSSSNWIPSKSPVEELDPYSHSSSAPNLIALRSSTENLNSDATEGGPKVGPRFSREAVKILRGWLGTHHRHPYPTEEEKESLRRQTGLNKIQVTNWLANARRRGNVRAQRSTSPSPNMDNYAKGMDIPRRGTPALQEMNPLERWKASPPEHEAASVTAIAKAVTSSTFSSGRDSPYTSYGHTEDGSARSLCNVSSASSLGTSHGTSHSSGGSFASAFSHKSRGSFGSFNSFGNRGRRRRRRQAPKPAKVSNLAIAPRTFQCTFCTETFKTKHDWQRHEKSLHLSLERWICSPNGPYQYCAEYNHLACVYCGLPNPPEGHAEQHNHSSCVERSLEERTFYRKDHLRQHLNLVHDVKFQAWSMDAWKVASPEIRSRCGFCGIVMESWSIRVDHLAEHFKGGNSMADWKGDWGFDAQVLDIVENGMPPYLIHNDRKTMRPFEASRQSADLERTLEDMVKLGLVDFINDRVVQGQVPLDEDLLEEGQKIIIKAEAVSKAPSDGENSWFRDLIMLSGKKPKFDSEKLQEMDPAGYAEIPWAERLEIIKSRLPKDRDNLASIQCSKERALMTFVHSRQAVGLTPTDPELQFQACKILDDVESGSNFKCKGAVSWFKYLVVAEPNWLAEFRHRAGLPRSSDMAIEHIRSTDDTSIDYSIHNFSRLENELREYFQAQLAAGISPTDADLQRKARLIIYKNDDPWNQTAADDPVLLENFKRQNGFAPNADGGTGIPAIAEVSEFGTGHMPATSSSPRTLHWDLENTGIGMIPSPVSASDRDFGSSTTTGASTSAALHTLVQNQPSTNTNPTQPLRYFLNDANCYARLVRELNRFVTSCMSPNNPNQHVPTDAEIQNQARWVIYDDDDPWNQTAADNAEWLVRFKRDIGLAPAESGPGLPLSQPSWRVGMGGTGFSPPYLNPKAPLLRSQKTSKTAGKFLQSMRERWQKPATVFCSRELEDGLGAFAKSELARGVVPTDAALRAKGREILGVQETAADESQLLEKFKVLYGIGSPTNLLEVSPSKPNSNSGSLASASAVAGPLPDFSLPNFTNDVDMLANFDMELGAMDFTTPFGAGTATDMENNFGLGPDGGAALMGMDLSGLDVSPPSLTSTSQSLSSLGPITQSLGIRHGSSSSMVSEMGGNHGMDGITEMRDGAMQDYAELYRVHAATASPLRRRVSEKAAMKVGSKTSPRNLYTN